MAQKHVIFKLAGNHLTETISVAQGKCEREEGVQNDNLDPFPVLPALPQWKEAVVWRAGWCLLCPQCARFEFWPVQGSGTREALKIVC